ncbi:MAG: response regulator [Bdellovibrio sp. CG10_big_fil_rev_8_21_14_0_10_47_8]|nr:MAG: response regulator [Bdellovibrio sp. CG10_big_fil_rev_8_21_14_0_10_47_8]
MNRKVLIVDDEPLVRRSLRRALETNSFQVIEAEDGRVGLDLWKKESPDIVFLDVLMPGLTGPQVLSEIDASLRQTSKVILISAYTGEYNLDSAKSLGADHFISKPFEDIFAIVKLVSEMVS